MSDQMLASLPPREKENESLGLIRFRLREGMRPGVVGLGMIRISSLTLRGLGQTSGRSAMGKKLEKMGKLGKMDRGMKGRVRWSG